MEPSCLDERSAGAGRRYLPLRTTGTESCLDVERITFRYVTKDVNWDIIWLHRSLAFPPLVTQPQTMNVNKDRSAGVSDAPAYVHGLCFGIRLPQRTPHKRRSTTWKRNEGRRIPSYHPLDRKSKEQRPLIAWCLTYLMNLGGILSGKEERIGAANCWKNMEQRSSSFSLAPTQTCKERKNKRDGTTVENPARLTPSESHLNSLSHALSYSCDCRIHYEAWEWVLFKLWKWRVLKSQENPSQEDIPLFLLNTRKEVPTA